MKRFLLLLALAVSPAFAQTDYVRDWLILGSFPHADATTRLSSDFLVGESAVKPRGGETVAGKAWLLYHSPREFIDFLWNDLPFSARERCAVYAAFFVQSPGEQKVRLMVGSDDGIKIWCNGQVVHQNDVYRGVVLDNDTVLVSLKSGWNTILMKVVNGDGGYGLSARFADGEGLVLNAENPFPPAVALTPASLRPAFSRPDFRFALTESQKLACSVGLPLLNDGSASANNLEVILSADGKQIARSEVPRIPGGELSRLRQPLSFADVTALAGGKTGSAVRIRYEGGDTTLTFDLTGDVLRAFFDPWELRGWNEQRITSNSMRCSRMVVVPEEISGLGFRVAVDIGDAWGSLSVNGTTILPRFSGDSGELLLARKAAARDTFHVEVFTTSGKPVAGSVLLASTVRLRHDAIERFLLDSRFAKEIYHLDLGNMSRVAGELLSVLRSHQLDRVDETLKPVNQTIASHSPEAKKVSLHLIGHAHIDMAWLWRVAETMDVTRATFQAALDNLKMYPDFHFSHGQAQSYRWIEEQHPEMFDEIQQYVNAGRWEIVGGTWVEPDANMPSGESLARQYLYGKRYFKEKFGVTVKHGFFPDTFGHPATLPQIMAKSGIETYTFFRPWEDERMFWWESPDGSRVFAYRPPNWYGTWSGIPDTLWRAAVNTQGTFVVKDAVQFFGVGDHGGGPTRRQIEQIDRLSKVTLYPDTRMSTFTAFYSKLVPQKRNAPVQRGEQNPVFEGCYTSQAKTKLLNRKAEALLPTAELFSSLAMRFGFEYPGRELREAWDRVLFNQFHDILCGSSIHEVYFDSEQYYQEAFEQAETALTGALRTLASAVSTLHRSKQAVPIVVLNPLNWSRSGPIEIPWKSDGAADPRVVDEKGREIPVQITHRSADSLRFLFVPNDVPSVGYRTFWITAGKRNEEEITDDLVLENRYFRVEVDRSSGCVSRILDKMRNREVLQEGTLGNQLQIQEDAAPMSAWVIGLKGEPKVIGVPSSVKVLESGPVRKVVRSEYVYEQSAFYMDVILYEELPRIDFRFTADWHHRQRILKVAFPLNVTDGKATFEIPYGSLQRQADGREAVAQKWVDVSSGDYGVSLLNDSRYGFDVRGSVARMTLLRSSTDPDPKADEGKHEFSYALYPHSGGWEAAGTVLRGYEFNTPMVAIPTDQHHGQYTPSHSFFTIKPSTVVLTALKKCEDDGSLILRFFETTGRPTQAQILFPHPVVSAAETDLIEWNERRFVTEGLKEGTILLSLKPFEIRTLKLTLGREQ